MRDGKWVTESDAQLFGIRLENLQSSYYDVYAEFLRPGSWSDLERECKRIRSLPESAGTKTFESRRNLILGDRRVLLSGHIKSRVVAMLHSLANVTVLTNDAFRELNSINAEEAAKVFVDVFSKLPRALRENDEKERMKKVKAFGNMMSKTSETLRTNAFKAWCQMVQSGKNLREVELQNEQLRAYIKTAEEDIKQAKILILEVDQLREDDRIRTIKLQEAEKEIKFLREKVELNERLRQQAERLREEAEEQLNIERRKVANLEILKRELEEAVRTYQRQKGALMRQRRILEKALKHWTADSLQREFFTSTALIRMRHWRSMHETVAAINDDVTAGAEKLAREKAEEKQRLDDTIYRLETDLQQAWNDLSECKEDLARLNKEYNRLHERCAFAMEDLRGYRVFGEEQRTELRHAEERLAIQALQFEADRLKWRQQEADLRKEMAAAIKAVQKDLKVAEYARKTEQQKARRLEGEVGKWKGRLEAAEKQIEGHRVKAAAFEAEAQQLRKEREAESQELEKLRIEKARQFGGPPLPSGFLCRRCVADVCIEKRQRTGNAVSWLERKGGRNSPGRGKLVDSKLWREEYEPPPETSEEYGSWHAS